jgi:RHS repeat-associated protein
MTTWKNFAGDSGRAITTWNYDPARGFLLNKRYSDDTGPSYNYKPSGRLLTRTWARGVTTTYSYNGAGDVAAIAYSDATPGVTTAYDRQDRAVTLTDGAGTRSFAYHVSGQVQGETYSAGLLNGIAVNRTFDSLYRLSGLSVPSVQSVAYGYDAASRLSTIASGNNTVTYAYATNSPLVQSLTFTNNGTPRLTTTKAYDNLNRLTSISSAPAASSVLSQAYRYNSANQRVQATREDNTSWNYGYDALGQVTSAQKRLADGATPALGLDYAYTYDDIGNRLAQIANTQTSNYTSNSLNQYSQRTVPGGIDVLGTAATDAAVSVNGQAAPRQSGAYYTNVPYANAVDSVWARIDIGATRNGVTAMATRYAWLPQNPEPFSYDADGNLTADSRWTYSWDAENRLAAMETRPDILVPDGPFPLQQRRRLEFAYDAQGRRVSKKVSNWTGSGWLLVKQTAFVYDGWNLIAEYLVLGTSNLSLLRTYTWGLDLSGSLQDAGGVGGLLQISAFSPSAFSVLPVYDGNGNVTGLVDATTGAPAGKYDYDAFGETVLIEGTYAETNSFRFSTKYADSESGFLYYGFRYYNPGTGRWLSRDPIEERGGVNLYGFVQNGPLNRIDAIGLKLSPCTPASRIIFNTDLMAQKNVPGQTGANWPGADEQAEVALQVGTTVTVKGEMQVYIFLDRFLKPDYTAADGLTPKKHETFHEAIYEIVWNTSRSDVDKWEGTYCKEGCARLGAIIANKVNLRNYYKAQYLNFEFDVKQYGFNPDVDSAGRERARSLADEYNSKMILAEDEVMRLTREFANSKCSLPEGQ